MKRWLWIGTALVLLAILVGGMLRQPGVFPAARRAASGEPSDEHAIRTGSADPERNMPVVSIKPTDEHTMLYIQKLLESWQSQAQEPTQRKP